MSISDQATLQSLLTGQSGISPATFQLAGTANGETVQIITVSNPSDLLGSAGKIWHVVPSVNSDIAHIIFNQGENQAAGNKENFLSVSLYSKSRLG